MRRVLMIAFHFPPLAGSSGIQRTLRFAQQLPQFGWAPMILSAHPRAYERTSADLDSEVPLAMPVARAQAWDAARHFAVAGRYPGQLARPDRWSSWQWDGLRTGLRMIKAHRPDALWSTYPIATAHLLAARLQRLSGLPWIADFRDPMAQVDYPTDPKVWRVFERIEQRIAARAAAMVFTTPGALRMYQSRFAQAAGRMALVENGYDEESFVAAAVGHVEPTRVGPLRLLHSGIVYPAERDPTHLLQALAQLQSRGIGTTDLRVRFRAPVHGEMIASKARELGIADMIEILPAVSYREALQEMLRSDYLLVMQATSCNEQIPAKVYEYLRVGRPIVALTDPAGDTGQVLAEAGIRRVTPLDNAAAIADVLQAVLAGELRHNVGSERSVLAASRLERTRVLAGVMSAALQHRQQQRPATAPC